MLRCIIGLDKDRSFQFLKGYVLKKIKFFLMYIKNVSSHAS